MSTSVYATHTSLFNNDGSRAITNPRPVMKKEMEPSNCWHPAPCKKGTVFTARTGHAVSVYYKGTYSQKELLNRYGFLSTQLERHQKRSTVPLLPNEVNLNIFSFLEEPNCQKILVFGGTNNRQRLNDLHEYNVESGEWKEVLPLQEGPSAPKYRSGARACLAEKTLFVFGGYDGRGGSYFNDLWSVNLGTYVWQQEALHSAVKPPPRTDHSMVTYKGELVLFAGYDGRNRFHDVHTFNPATKQWTLLETRGEVPSRRFGHSAACYGDSMYVFGGWDGSQTLAGLHRFRFGMNHWSDVEINGPPPPHRYRHTSVVLSDCLFIFGGVDSEHRRFNDLRCFNFSAKSWTNVELTGEIPTRSFHSAVVLKDQMYVVGGYDGVNRLNDMHHCSLKIGVPQPEEDNIGDEDL